MKTIFSTMLLLLVTFAARGQDKKLSFDLDYTTEGQYNFSNTKANWVNLLDLSLEYKPWKNGSVDLQTISVYKTSEKRIADDLQTFSNIEEDNMALNIFMGGYTHTFGCVSIFGGLRNVNNDYFTQEYTSALTNSVCGIYSTIAENYPLANYPLSAMCLHAEVRFTDALKLKSSFYNGVARQLFNDTGYSIFEINPNRDGTFNMTKLGYTNKKNFAYYSVGLACHTSYTDLAEKTNPVRKHFGYTLWGTVEQSVYQIGNKEVGLLAQASFAPMDGFYCSRYFGLGTVMKGVLSSKNDNYIGVFLNYAKFSGNTEKFIETTCRYNLTDNFAIQPVFNYIITGKEVNCIGMLRLNCTFNQ